MEQCLFKNGTGCTADKTEIHIFENSGETGITILLFTFPLKRENATPLAVIAEVMKNRGFQTVKINAKVTKYGGIGVTALWVENDDFETAVSVLRRALECKITHEEAENAVNSVIRNVDSKSLSEKTVEKLIDMVYENDGFSVHEKGYAEETAFIEPRELNSVFSWLKKYVNMDLITDCNVSVSEAERIVNGIAGKRNGIRQTIIDETDIVGGCAEKSESSENEKSHVAVAYTVSLKPWGRDYCTSLIIAEMINEKISEANENLCMGLKFFPNRMLYVIYGEAYNENRIYSAVDNIISEINTDEKNVEKIKRAVSESLKTAETVRKYKISEYINSLILSAESQNISEILKRVTAEDVKRAVLTKKGVYTVSAVKRTFP